MQEFEFVQFVNTERGGLMMMSAMGAGGLGAVVGVVLPWAQHAGQLRGSWGSCNGRGLSSGNAGCGLSTS